MISFIHISDIHFRKFSGDKYDIDDDLRNEIINDINNNAKSNLKNIEGVLVCGDVAFSGKSTEYKIATEFLNDICSILEISEEKVYCVPGNHDVDQAIPQSSTFVKKAQDALASSKSNDEFDESLAKFCRNDVDGKLLYAPISTYNTDFAGKYNCDINPKNPQWFNKFALNDQYQLGIFGINSTIISNADDHAPGATKERLMYVGQHQIPKRFNNIIYLTLCHHPPECWFDPDLLLQNKMNARVHIQLYGHKHIQTINKKGSTLIVGSGATHPSRSEPNWLPRYNWISIYIDTINGENILYVKIYPRILDTTTDHFIADRNICGDNIFKVYEIPLIADLKEIVPQEIVHEETNEMPFTNNINLTLDGYSYKAIIYGFMNLPHVIRNRIITKFSLGKDEDDGLKHYEIVEKIIERAKERKCFNEFLREINKYS